MPPCTTGTLGSRNAADVSPTLPRRIRFARPSSWGRVWLTCNTEPACQLCIERHLDRSECGIRKAGKGGTRRVLGRNTGNWWKRTSQGRWQMLWPQAIYTCWQRLVFPKAYKDAEVTVGIGLGHLWRQMIPPFSGRGRLTRPVGGLRLHTKYRPPHNWGLLTIDLSGLNSLPSESISGHKTGN